MNIVTEKVKRFAEAIRHAEGSDPKYNNPGDLIQSFGYPTNGVFGEGILIFDTPEDGLNALYKQLEIIITGQSHVYNLDMTISDMAYLYTTTNQDDWSDNVAEYLGVSRDTRLREVLT